MLQAGKDASISKETNVEEKGISTSTQQQITSLHAISSIDQRRTAIVANTIGSPATVILSENNTSDAGTLQYHRVALGTPLQHVVGSVQVPGPSSSIVSDSTLPVKTKCTIASTQDLTHILVASTTNSLHSTVGLQNSVVNVSASTPHQYQTIGNITNVAQSKQRTKLEMGGTVLAQPIVQTSLAQRIVLNSNMSDIFALRIAPGTMASGGTTAQQIMVLESPPGVVPSSDVTKVHSYSLPSAAVSPLTPASTIQKMIISGSGQLVQATGMPQKGLVGNIPLNPSRTAAKRPFSSTTVTVPETTSTVNSIKDMMSHLHVANKLLTGLMPIDSKVPTGIPSSPKPKKMKLEKLSVNNKEVILKRKKATEFLSKKLRLLQIKYYLQQTEYFFLKNNGNMMDFLVWRKKIPPQLLDYLKANSFDPVDDMKLVLEILSRGPALLSAGISNISAQGVSNDQTLSIKSVTSSSHSPSLASRINPPSTSQSISNSSPSSSAQTMVTKSVKQPLVTHKLSAKHNSISSVYDSQIGSQEEIVERAKQEAYVMQRIGDLRKEGLWSLKRLPKVQECPRNKAHWDYLIEEMAWLATDFAQERKWKKAAAKKCARMITKYFQEKEIKAEKAEREEQMKLRKIAAFISKEIKQFWSSIEKLVEYKQQAWLDEKRKKALDVHLNFIVDQTEKYSSWLTQGMNRDLNESKANRSYSPSSDEINPPSPKKRKHSNSNDGEFKPLDSETDDEETIQKEEEIVDETEQNEEVKLLQQESEMSFEDFLETLPPEILESAAKPVGLNEEDDDKANVEKIKEELLSIDAAVKSNKENEEQALSNLEHDDDFKISSDEDDEEQTISEQEELEKNVDHQKEIKELEEENLLSIEELRQKYAGAYTEDFDLQQESSSEDEEMSLEEDISGDEESENPDADITDADITVKSEDMELDSHNVLKNESFDENKDHPSREISDIAATAERCQPKGNTLSTTQVFTKVPFLLKHQLREYQHIGLDWLNAMYDKKLNGILADEMGLGKTIQTISILAHLACDKGIWGPHLIVVPTSVLLNWEMEFKKWCPGFKILTYYGTPKERKHKRIGWTKPNAFHICITSYKLVVQDHQAFRRKKWKYLILDEAQHIKNFKSQRWQMLLNFQSTHRLLLTGTPLQNNLMELWSLMHFLMPNVFQSHKEFREWFVNPVTGMIEGSHEYNESLIKRLHKVLRPFLLRRLKSEVEKQLPKKYEHIIMCRLSKRQRFLYDDFMAQTKTKETLATGNFMSVINILMQLRKVCNHPNMFEERPTISSFLMSGITYYTSSLICRALEYDPFKHINLMTLNLLLSDLELSLSAFAAHRIMNFRTPARLIEDLDNLPDPPPPCPFFKMRINFCNSQGSARSSQVSHQSRNTSQTPGPRLPSISARLPAPSTPTLPYTQRLNILPGQQPAQAVRNANPVAAVTASPVGAVSCHPLISQNQTGELAVQFVSQPTPGVPVAQLTSLGNQVLTSTHLTLQIQHTTQTGNRVPIGGIQSLIGGIGRVLHTASGPHFVITSVPNTVAEGQQITASSAASQVIPSTAASVQSLVLTPNVATATVLPHVQKMGTPVTASNLNLTPTITSLNRTQNNTPIVASLANQAAHNKPVGRVAPLNVHPPVSSAAGG